MIELTAPEIEQALAAVGELLAAEEEEAAIVVVGGATLNLLGIVDRSTSDVDVIARARRDPDGTLRLERAKPFPPPLARAIQTVARDFELPSDWMNATVDAQWVQGLPPGLAESTDWRNYGGGLDVGLAGRPSLIALKLYAAADSDPRSVHVQDLKALGPSAEELEEAAAWVLTQDAAPEWASLVSQVIEYVGRSRS